MNESTATADATVTDATVADTAVTDGVPKRWYVVQAYAGYEKRVQQSLREIIDRSADDMRACFGDKPRMKVTFAPGELVRIIDGPFAEFNGTVEEVNSEKAKLRVSVMILGRSTPVELDFVHVAKG